MYRRAFDSQVSVVGEGMEGSAPKTPRRSLQGLVLSSLIASAVASALVAPVAEADQALPVAVASSARPGTIVGVVTDAANQPLAHATVTAVRIDGNGIHATVSGIDGVYSLGELPPGVWSISMQADGYGEVAEHSIEVLANKATRYDVAMTKAPTGGPASTALAQAATPNGTGSAAVASTGSTTGPAAGAQVASTTQPAAQKSTTAGSTLSDKLWLKLAKIGLTPGPNVAQNAPAGAPAPTAADVSSVLPEALQTPPPGPANDTVTPWANVGYTGWMNGNTRENNPIFDTKFFTPEIRFDVNYLQDFNHPVDHTIDGSTEEFRSGEFQIEQVSFGGNFHWNNVQARFLSMLGLFAVTTPRNDASQAVGQWDLQGAYKYMSEANAGYHFDNIGHGLNIDAGIFVSYIGLFSYYNFDNWTYQPSYVSSNTPWFFNGLRIQWWPTQDLKIEPWLINGWQSYAKFNSHPGFGGQILWIPHDWLKLVFNTYTLGQDNISNQFTNGVPLNAGANGNQTATVATMSLPGTPSVDWSKVQRIHEDDSLLIKYFDQPEIKDSGISRMAFSLTWDIGCEYGGGVSCTGGPNKESFIGAMLYNRIWWDHNKLALTIGGGAFNNPGRYLALTPPINGATAATGTAYFSQEPGMKLYQWDTQMNLQFMPNDWITYWAEGTFRHSNVPYWSGPGGITAPGAVPAGAGAATGNVNGVPGGLVCNDGTTATANECAYDGGLWQPDLRTREVVFGVGVMVKF